MGTKNDINPIQAYCEGQFRATFVSCISSGVISERQIDAVKEYTSKERTIRAFISGERRDETPVETLAGIIY